MGYHLIQRVRRFEEKAHKLGFRLGNPRHGNWSGEQNVDMVALYPRDEELPSYTRDAELFVGSLTNAEEFLRGIVWARDYDKMLKVSTVAKRERKEQDERNRKLAQIIKGEATDIDK